MDRLHLFIHSFILFTSWWAFFSVLCVIPLLNSPCGRVSTRETGRGQALVVRVGARGLCGRAGGGLIGGQVASPFPSDCPPVPLLRLRPSRQCHNRFGKNL